MRTVHKFPLHVTKITTIKLPLSAVPMLTGLCPRDGGPAVWFELDTNHCHTDRYFLIRGTGHEVYEDEIHVGSLIDRSFVWHVYERRA